MPASCLVSTREKPVYWFISVGAADYEGHGPNCKLPSGESEWASFISLAIENECREAVTGRYYNMPVGQQVYFGLEVAFYDDGDYEVSCFPLASGRKIIKHGTFTVEDKDYQGYLSLTGLELYPTDPDTKDVALAGDGRMFDGVGVFNLTAPFVDCGQFGMGSRVRLVHTTLNMSPPASDIVYKSGASPNQVGNQA